MLSYIQESYQEVIPDTVSSVLCVTVTLDCSGQLYHTLSQVKICLNERISLNTIGKDYPQFLFQRHAADREGL